MDPTITPADLAAGMAPETFGNHLASIKPSHDHMGHHGRVASVREAEYEGHKIKIVTTYEITVDGRPFAVGLKVHDDGTLSCHGLPTYQFASAVETVQALIRKYPKYFPKDR
ncbi:hypothetical protein [Streptomyces kanasensis]|uniref:hypothetical protein n=1 Tax=Streptomyces kanasensis TaxID=936756 RepID=UPI0036FE9573